MAVGVEQPGDESIVDVVALGLGQDQGRRPELAQQREHGDAIEGAGVGRGHVVHGERGVGEDRAAHRREVLEPQLLAAPGHGREADVHADLGRHVEDLAAGHLEGAVAGGGVLPLGFRG